MLSRIDGTFLALDTEHGIYRDHLSGQLFDAISIGTCGGRASERKSSAAAFLVKAMYGAPPRDIYLYEMLTD